MLIREVFLTPCICLLTGFPANKIFAKPKKRNKNIVMTDFIPDQNSTFSLITFTEITDIQFVTALTLMSCRNSSVFGPESFISFNCSEVKKDDCKTTVAKSPSIRIE